ncbi:helicase-exonuclease AddAB subunit AddA [Mesobacillus subterraneus]|uniref:ATP-dependent helicase/nuclease subunit A n=1 Tax=Mesobacillus subterraneus TaxID=285983 RepID=A0A0D6ZBU4_9BACI|nr:helicase-exonuclease AddAB subunit AddA [Mesobacillus subterraneus]KIY23264.1 ATP-dependent helicase [Mesobacillus subterraneus]
MAKTIIPPIPAGETWTEDQWKAIMSEGKDILVAAAAGSGKTAVLVERIIKKITSENNLINVDELLVVTFTNASAAEMRHRIGEALEKAIGNHADSAHLIKQLSLLNRASISTLHSFCLEVIRKYYYLIDIDPGFRIADATEGQLLRDEVIEELFEEEYGKADNQPFFHLVDAFTNDRSDEGLKEIIADLFDFARSNPSPDAYLDSIVTMYDAAGCSAIEDLPFMNVLTADIELQLYGAKQLLEKALELSKMPGGPAPRAVNFTEDLHVMDTLLAASEQSWGELHEAIQLADFGRAKICRGDEYNKDLVDKAAKLRDRAKKIVQDLRNELFSRKPESFLKDMQEMRPLIAVLIGLVKEFSRRFAEVKQERGIVDFSDLEHYTLEILTAKTEEENVSPGVPSEAALAYRNKFKEVLVDEYQDVNMVQEAILQLVSMESEAAGNLFMVGDMKQSIYKFRLAEPTLFLGKYNRFTAHGEGTGLKIDLAKNFRSRSEVLDGTNYLFKQIMGATVGEIHYDDNAELKKGALYPDDDSFPVELLLIDRGEGTSSDSDSSAENEAAEAEFDAEDLEQSQLEARLMAKHIKDMVEERRGVYNPKMKTSKPIHYRDIVILLRSMTWAPQIMEEFKRQGIPIYANLSTGYFQATEVAVMLSLLKVIDNPYQDIPLAAVLRSPIVGLDEEELAIIRISQKRGSFYEALTAFCLNRPTLEKEALHEKTSRFFEALKKWRTAARQGSVSDLIWQLYRETRFFDFAGGMPGGKQRQANLRALYDRARQYEATSFRGLFRFLRFIERMRERGDDLGAARALGEQEDVVRIMTIHSSKGLEFPVVFVAGLARKFNTMDLKKFYMLDKEFGFAAKYINPEKRISFPSLPQLAFKRKHKMEMLAEEMRVLYVALTRAKEKLYLIGSVNDAVKTIGKWQDEASQSDWLLDDYVRASASGYIDWIGPAIIRHKDCESIKGSQAILHPQLDEEIRCHPSRWKIATVNAEEIVSYADEKDKERDGLMDLVAAGQAVNTGSKLADKVHAQLSWKYPYKEAANFRSKQSVTELKRNLDTRDEESGTQIVHQFTKQNLNRPRFMREKMVTPAERGTAMHMVMQHLDLSRPVTDASLVLQLAQMVEKELLFPEQKEAVDQKWILAFFDTEIGQRLLEANNVRREVPFYLSLPAKEVYPDWQSENEPIFIQGVIDCIFEDEKGIVLLDFKTDGINDRYKGGFEQAKPILKERYQVQISLYAKAIQQLWKKPVEEKYLYFFDGGHLLEMDQLG